METSDWILAAGAVATFLLAAVAVFGDTVRGWLIRPRLEVTIDLGPPDCHKTKLAAGHSEGGVPSIEEDVYFLRLRVTNLGNEKAVSVEVFASQLERTRADGTFQRADSFLPMNLFWSHTERAVFSPAISPRMYRHCDFAHIVRPAGRAQFKVEDTQWPNVSPTQTILSIDTVVKSYSLPHLLPPGTYRLTILVAAANAKPIRRTLEVTLNGGWYDDPQDMFGQGVAVRLL